MSYQPFRGYLTDNPSKRPSLLSRRFKLLPTTRARLTRLVVARVPLVPLVLLVPLQVVLLPPTMRELRREVRREVPAAVLLAASQRSWAVLLN